VLLLLCISPNLLAFALHLHSHCSEWAFSQHTPHRLRPYHTISNTQTHTHTGRTELYGAVSFTGTGTQVRLINHVSGVPMVVRSLIEQQRKKTEQRKIRTRFLNSATLQAKQLCWRPPECRNQQQQQQQQQQQSSANRDSKDGKDASSRRTSLASLCWDVDFTRPLKQCDQSTVFYPAVSNRANNPNSSHASSLLRLLFRSQLQSHNKLSNKLSTKKKKKKKASAKPQQQPQQQQDVKLPLELCCTVEKQSSDNGWSIARTLLSYPNEQNKHGQCCG